MAGRHMARRRGGRRALAIAVGVLVIGTVVAAALVARSGGFTFQAGQPTGCEGRRVDLTVAASPDKAALLAELAEAYTASGPLVRGSCVDISVQSKEPAEVGPALVQGWDTAVDGPEPDVWVPPSSSWLYTLAELPDGEALLAEEHRSIARSPVVIAMPRPMAEAVGWPERGLGWGELIELSRDPRGWSRFEHPDWGPFKLGLSPPDRSTAGLQTLLGIQAALATGAEDDPRVTNAARAGERAAAEALQQVVLGGIVQFERAVAHYANTSDELLQQLREADGQDGTLSFLSAFPLEEQAIWEYNQGFVGDEEARGDATKPRVPLAAVYPSDGAPEADHPFVVLNTPKVNRDRRAAAAGFRDFLLSPQAQQRFLRVGYRGVESNRGFIGTEENGLLAGQPAPALPTPPLADVGRTVRTWAALSQRGMILSLIDVSGSMKEPVPGTGKTKLQIAAEAATLGVGFFGRDTEVGLWEFSTALDGPRDYREVISIGPLNEAINGVPRREAVARAYARLRPREDTGLYDSTLAAYEHAKRHWQPERINTVVLLTDGQNDDPAGSISLQQLVSRLKDLVDPEKPIGIITIAYGADADVGALRQISEATGGSAFVSKDPADITRIILTALTS